MLSHILITVLTHMHATAPCSAHTVAQAHPTMSYIPLVYIHYVEQFLLLPGSKVATTLLVESPTLTMWIPGQTPLVSTSSYSGLVQSLPVCNIIVGGQLMARSN